MRNKKGKEELIPLLKAKRIVFLQTPAGAYFGISTKRPLLLGALGRLFRIMRKPESLTILRIPIKSSLRSLEVQGEY